MAATAMLTRLLRLTPNLVCLALIATGAILLYRSWPTFAPQWVALTTRYPDAKYIALVAVAGVVLFLLPSTGRDARRAEAARARDPVRSAVFHRSAEQGADPGSAARGTAERDWIGAATTTTVNAADVLRRRAQAWGERLAGEHFERGSVGLLHGPSGEGKSQWLAEVVRAITRGESVFGWPTRQAAVLWVTEESLDVWRGKAAVIARPEELTARWWQRWHRRRSPRRYPPTCWPLSLRDLRHPLTLDTLPAFLDRLERDVRRVGAGLVIGDTIARVCGEALTSNVAAERFMGLWAAFAVRANVAVELVHHDNDDGNPLGPKEIKGQADYVHHQHRLPRTDKQDRRRMVEFEKRYEPYPPPPLVYTMRDDGRLEAVTTAAESPHPLARGDLADQRSVLELRSPSTATQSPAIARNCTSKDTSTLLPEHAAIITALATLPRLPNAPGIPFMVLLRALNVPKATLHRRLQVLERAGQIARTVHQGNTYWHAA
jgi:hypothetical protein